MKKFLAAGAVALAALSLTTGTASAADPTAPSITDIAAGNADFETLVAGVTAAGYAELFDNCAEDAPLYTVFAPTDAAFEALPEGTLTTLLAEPGLVTLKNILQYHVLTTEVDAAAAKDAAGTSVTALNGDMIAVSVVDDGVVLNGTVNVVVADLQACNGIIHVIDAVLMPPTEDDGGDMPGTGSNLTMTIIALGLLAMGSVIVLGARRRATV